MNMHVGLTPLISLLAGILILVMPRLLNYSEISGVKPTCMFIQTSPPSDGR